MNLSESETRRLREAMSDQPEILGDGSDCPTSELIWRSAAEQLDARANAEVVRHIGECTACGIAWELARQLASSEPTVAASPRPRRSWAPLAAAAVLLVAVGGVWMLQQRTPEAPVPSYRDAAGGWLLSAIAPADVLPRDACVLRWSAGPEGTTYDVRVTDGTLEPLARAWSLEIPELRIDPEALSSVPPGERVFWRVTAHTPDGGQTASVTFITRVE